MIALKFLKHGLWIEQIDKQFLSNLSFYSFSMLLLCCFVTHKFRVGSAPFNEHSNERSSSATFFFCFCFALSLFQIAQLIESIELNCFVELCRFESHVLSAFYSNASFFFATSISSVDDCFGQRPTTVSQS